MFNVQIIYIGSMSSPSILLSCINVACSKAPLTILLLQVLSGSTGGWPAVVERNIGGRLLLRFADEPPLPARLDIDATSSESILDKTNNLQFDKASVKVCKIEETTASETREEERPEHSSVVIKAEKTFTEDGTGGTIDKMNPAAGISTPELSKNSETKSERESTSFNVTTSSKYKVNDVSDVPDRSTTWLFCTDERLRSIGWVQANAHRGYK